MRRVDVRWKFDKCSATRLSDNYRLGKQRRRGAFALDGRTVAPIVIAEFWMLGVGGLVRVEMVLEHNHEVVFQVAIGTAGALARHAA
jgi:hypothetical protein